MRFSRTCQVGKMKDIKAIEIITENETIKQDAGKYVEFVDNKLFLSYDKSPVLSVKVTWENTYFQNAKLLGDSWERAYGDMEWKNLEDSQKMPWYFLAYARDGVYAFGVKTKPNSLCYWECSKEDISLTMIVKNGTRGVELGKRKLELCHVVNMEYEWDVFYAAEDFCRVMCDSPRVPKRPIFGGNDWYCNYGNNSHEKILKHTKRIVECTKNCAYPPYMVIDDGWEICHHQSENDDEYYNGGPWEYHNRNFHGMEKMAEDIKREGAIPGIWFRPLWTVEKFPDEMILKFKGIKYVLDPSVPAVLEQIKSDISTFKKWGYKLIKFDFSSFDIFGKWGFEMDDGIDECIFHDRSRTSAEIIKDMYSAMRQAAGDDVLLMGCNTFGHLAAGFVDIQRTGDDTSGIDWERTKKYGVNTLAFRMNQHKAFFFVDADCVGITKAIPWEKNKQWLDVLAKSGTPLFVSIADDADFDGIRGDLIEAFKKASGNDVVSKPIDWMENMQPKIWESAYGTDQYDW